MHFRKLRESEDLADVTLVCKDGQKFPAHKVILASSSPFFWNLLTSDKLSHQTLIFMRGSRSADMVALLDFLYQGEANVDQENINSFLQLAEDLQLRGLNQTTEEILSQIKPVKKGRPKKYFKRANAENYTYISL